MQKEGSTHILSFVDFASPAHAAVALDALQGKFLLWEALDFFFVRHIINFAFPLDCIP